MTTPAEHSKAPPFYLSFAAGSLGQGLEMLGGGHVLTRIVTEQEAHPQRGSIIKTMRYLYNQNGLREFYTGLRWNLALGCLKAGMRWGLNNKLFDLFGKKIPKPLQDDHKWVVPVAVGLSGAAFETLYQCPFESLRTREMTQNWRGYPRMWEVIKTDGISIFYKGWKRFYVRQAITWNTYLLVYGKLRGKVLTYRKERREEITTADKIFMNAATGATACLLNTPFDMLRTQLQKYQPLKEKHLIAAISNVVHSHGFKGLYLSLPTRVLRSMWYAVATFTVMDKLNALPEQMKLK